ncbi:hypothetical protein [Candidatus Brocadia sp. AMX2]|uniref:hypothetical protein n=1 Tax=Candidatus Brocadia sp. AMX2 TaxID=2293635 RepID=UPI002554BB0B|nr:hypothetical protein [Candidatus Brocadia sp. AMX2]
MLNCQILSNNAYVLTQEVTDDDGHRYYCGKCGSICRKAFNVLGCEPYVNYSEFK